MITQLMNSFVISKSTKIENLFPVSPVYNTGYYGEVRCKRSIPGNKKLTISYDFTSNCTDGAGNMIVFYKDYQTPVYTIRGTGLHNQITFTLPADCIQVLLYFYSKAPTGEARTGMYDKIMLEVGEVAHPYIPYLGDVVQVCDYSNYSTYTRTGFSLAKQATGWLANGTAPGDNDIPVGTGHYTAGHKYLFIGTNKTTNGFMISTFSDGGVREYNGNGVISTVNFTTTVTYRLYIVSGTFTNDMFFPQIYDLTAIYGVGNEPTSLADFRKDFPKSYYPYNYS